MEGIYNSFNAKFKTFLAIYYRYNILLEVLYITYPMMLIRMALDYYNKNIAGKTQCLCDAI